MKALILFTLAVLACQAYAKWRPSPSLRLLLETARAMKMTAETKAMFQDALYRELLMDKGLRIRKLMSQHRQLGKKSKALMKSTTPMASSPEVVKAVTEWMTALHARIDRAGAVHEWYAHRNDLRQQKLAAMSKAFNDTEGSMCKRVMAAGQLMHADQFDAGDKPEKNKEECKKMKKAAKEAWKKVKEAAKEHLVGGDRRRNQQMVKNEGGDVLTESGDNDDVVDVGPSQMCGGEGADLCRAAQVYFGALTAYYDASEKRNDAKANKHLAKAACLTELEGILVDGDKPNATVTFAQMVGQMKDCKKKMKGQVAKGDKNAKKSMKEAMKTFKKANKQVDALLHSQCSGGDTATGATDDGANATKETTAANTAQVEPTRL